MAATPFMSQDLTQPLTYAPPAAPGRGDRWFQVVAMLLAAAGVAANVGFIGLAVYDLHRAGPVYRNLMINPKAYGREVELEQIATLRRPLRLWAAQSAFIAAAAAGIVLALTLLAGATALHRDPLAARRRLEAYARWKPLGAAATGAALMWAAWESLMFWSTATRHRGVGSGPAFCETIVLLACALLPVWWVRRELPPERAARSNGVALRESEMPDFNFVLDDQASRQEGDGHLA